MKQLLEATFRLALAELAPGPRVRTALRERGADLAACPRVSIVAIGKAARPMALAAVDELATLAPHARVDGVCAPPEPDAAPLPPLSVVPGGHPLPTQGSFDAARRALDVCAAADASTVVLFLVSGGASSICELPRDPSVAVEAWRDFYRALVGSGAGIEDVNAIRAAASATKGGKLALAARRAFAQWTFAISDVPGGAIAALGSGPSVVGSFADGTMRRALQHPGLRAAAGLAGAVPDVHAAVAAGEATGEPGFEPTRCVSRILLDNTDAVEAAARSLRQAGVRVRVVAEFDEAPSEEAARGLIARLRAEAADGEGPIAIVAGGEVRVALPRTTGIGGRNQHFLLQCAVAIDGEPISILSCGTDGIDGNSSAAGGFVDGTTARRARSRGLDVAASLDAFDSSTLLRALGDTVVTGPTGTNVRDLRILIAHEPTH